MSNDLAIKIDHVSKEYRLGMIGGATLRQELQTKFAKLRGKEDPNLKIGQKAHEKNERFLALDDVSLEIRKGERVGIIGHNGAGKSTLLKLICRVTAPSKGEIYLNGRVTSMLEVGTGFHGELTGKENVYLNGAILGLSRAEIDKKYDEIVEFSEVGQFIDTPVKRYSSGMHVKLGFAVASHLDSEIMIMDEVLAVGDMAFQKKCIERMRLAAEDEGRTILYVSHNMRTIRELCDRVIVLGHGKILFDGDVETGIKIYIGENLESRGIYYNFRKANRPFEQHGQDLYITDFRFLNAEEERFDRRDPVVFEIEFDVKKDLPELNLYFTIISHDIKIGTTQTMVPFLDAKAGKHYKEKFKFDISNLSSGKYLFNLDIFISDDMGNYHSLDHPVDSIGFEIIDKHPEGIKWKNKYFGNVRLNPIESLGGECVEND